ncbi:hypothetical protein DFX32_RS17695 [Vibrio parahaemolyticus]|uniref:hypothetical protein n=1 Tax=Vibrio harveyi group TaxID=717610 RepID=UPI001AA1C3D1|nr:MULTISPECIES: hypothetical protein [Vibrio harveyi group]EGQ8329959.1 hypothetical protein [Vibrio parahaemolyticus]EGQ8789154.1 hypothetical protein [Vibrio parahaemolyticus]EGQ8818461.1 hypothetical protein [Vibrio parahaemolyticus]EGQ8848044.1 hypothetical protein [Vibrio parahaemolyticus]EJG0296502.1 hypothetical protein [Vibrio parahaemolyticus]
MLEEGYKKALAALKVQANAAIKELPVDRKSVVHAQSQMSIYDNEYQHIVRLVITNCTPVIDLDEQTLAMWLNSEN